MELNPYEKNLLGQYREFHVTGIPRPRVTSHGPAMALAMILYNAVGGLVLCGMSFPTVGGVMLGFAVAVAYMAFARWRTFGKVWPALDRVIDWAKVDSLLEQVPDNGT